MSTPSPEQVLSRLEGVKSPLLLRLETTPTERDTHLRSSF